LSSSLRWRLPTEARIAAPTEFGRELGGVSSAAHGDPEPRIRRPIVRRS
jgi:hypothetical protein